MQVYWGFRTDVLAVNPSASSEASLHRNSAHLKTENTPKFIWKAFVIVNILAATNREWLPTINWAAASPNEEAG